MTPAKDFSVGYSSDLVRIAQRTGIDLGLDQLRGERHVHCEVFDATAAEASVTWAEDFDAVYLGKTPITKAVLECSPRLLLAARWGVGYDRIDVDACTQAGVLVTITPDGVRRPMAVAMMSMLLALSTSITQKDRFVRSGAWSQERHLGIGTTGRTLGLIGLGNIGREFLKLVEPLDMDHLVYDPYVSQADVGETPAFRSTTLEELLETSDFVCVCCPLTAQTHHLLDREHLGLMKPSASLLNAARGPIVDEGALAEALERGSIRAAALDVFEVEPLPADSPLRRLDNVVLSPHSIGWSDEILAGNARSALRAIISVSRGQRPAEIVNPAALEHPRLRRALDLHGA